MLQRAVFLDRDGTIARDVPYCRHVDDFVILPGVPEAVRLLNECAFKVVVITNQSGISRGYFTEETLSLIHRKMKEELKKHGASVDAIYYCPHHPDDDCECRKPKPGLLLHAAEDMGISLRLSYMIGDDRKDTEAGREAGCRTVWLTTDQGPSVSEPHPQMPNHVARDLYEAVQWVIRDTGSTPVESMQPTTGSSHHDHQK